jgi:hypothetical protein
VDGRPTGSNLAAAIVSNGDKSPFYSKPFRQESPESVKLVEAVIIKSEGSDAKSESWGLEDLFETPQISRQTRMPNLMERKSTRRVENGGPSRPA